MKKWKNIIARIKKKKQYFETVNNNKREIIEKNCYRNNSFKNKTWI